MKNLARWRLVVEKQWLGRGCDPFEAVSHLVQDRTPVLIGESANDYVFEIVPTLAVHAPEDTSLEALANSELHCALDRLHQEVTCERWPNGIIFLKAAFHSWALWSWSQWCSENHSHPSLLVHLDAHHDLGAPPVLMADSPNCFRLPLRREFMSLLFPESVALAVGTGAIGIGSFIVPLLQALGGIDVLHIVPNGGCEEPITRRQMIVYGEPFRWFGGEGYQPHVALNERRLHGENHSTFDYILASGSQALSELDANGPVLLDIDMDYFCNRYDTNILDRRVTCVAEILDQIQVLLSNLRSSPMRRRVSVISVALSPGFFPAAYWNPCVNTLVDGLRLTFTQ